jgi:hypothetical protein
MNTRVAGIALASVLLLAAAHPIGTLVGPARAKEVPRTPLPADVARAAVLQGATSDPAVVSWGAGRLDLFVRGPDNALWHKYYANNAWSAWQSLGGGLASGPAVASWGAGHLDVFVRGTDNALWHKYFVNNGWSGWESLGGVITSDPAAVAWGVGRVDVFARGTDQALYHKWYSGAWSGWARLGGTLASGPAVSSWAAGRLDVFARGADNTLQHTWFDGSWAGTWESLGGSLASDPAAVSWGPGRIDVFARGTDNLLQHAWYEGRWSAWESFPGGLTSGPDATRQGVGRLDVVARGTDNNLYQRSWHSGWSEWLPLGAPGVTAVVATTTATPTTQPPTDPLIPPTSTPTVMSDGPAPTGLTATGTPTTATIRWTAVPGAANYRVNRAPAGTTTWTAVTPSPITTTSVSNDALPDHRLAYTYQVLAYQANGHFGAATVNYTPPAPTDPTRLAAAVSTPASVQLTWQAAPGASGYQVSGPGVANGTQTPSTSFTIASAPPGSNVYRVASIFTPGGVLTPAANWPSVTAPVPPRIGAPFLTIRNGPGSNGEAWLHADRARLCGPPPSLTEYSDSRTCLPTLATAGPISLGAMLEGAFVSPNPFVSKAVQNARDSLLRAVYLESAVFGDSADLGVGRRVWCKWRAGGPWYICLASSHGPGPGPRLEYGDPHRVADAAARNTEFRGFTVILPSASEGWPGLRFLVFAVAPEVNLSGVSDPAERFVLMLRNAYVLTDPGPPLFASANLDMQGPKFPPHACLSCHGGRYVNGDVIGASLLPLDPSRFAFSTLPGATRAEQEPRIREINNHVVRFAAPPMVQEYLAGLYGSGTAIGPATADFVPTGWATQPGLWRSVIRPYCTSCHMAQTGPLAFASWADVLVLKDAVQRTICKDATMPHAELLFRRFWGTGGAVSLPGMLSTALGFSSCP